ncbi:MAG: MAPEG family protein [Pseudomonadota bacterium]
MTERKRVLIGMIAGLVWSVSLLVVAALYVTIPVFALIPTIMTAFFGPGLVLTAMIGCVSHRRFSKGKYTGPLSEAGEIDRSVVQNTTEQLVIAAAIWPAAAVILGPYGPGVIVVLGFGFTLARLVFWFGSHNGPAMRAAGFAGTYFPTILVALWALATLVS